MIQKDCSCRAEAKYSEQSQHLFMMCIPMLLCGFSSHRHHDVVPLDVSRMFLTLLVCVTVENNASCYCVQPDTIERSGEVRCL